MDERKLKKIVKSINAYLPPQEFCLKFHWTIYGLLFAIAFVCLWAICTAPNWALLPWGIISVLVFAYYVGRRYCQNLSKEREIGIAKISAYSRCGMYSERVSFSAIGENGDTSNHRTFIPDFDLLYILPPQADIDAVVNEVRRRRSGTFPSDVVVLALYVEIDCLFGKQKFLLHENLVSDYNFHFTLRQVEMLYDIRDEVEHDIRELL